VLLVVLRLIQGFSVGGDQELVEFFDGILENNMRAAQRAKEMLLPRFQSKSSTTGGSEEPKPLEVPALGTEEYDRYPRYPREAQHCGAQPSLVQALDHPPTDPEAD
jgi:hypothetical protein